MKANREAYGEALAELGAAVENLVVLDADLAKATYTCKFKEVFPERFFDCGIAEQNMINVAAGLAATGYIPFASSFAMFAGLRAAEQYRNGVCYPKLNVKVVATHAGLECGQDGATHQALEDMAIMRAIPGNTVLVPADHVATKALVKEAAEFVGPCYIRIGRDKNEAIYEEGEDFPIGRSKKLREGSDAAVIACGAMVAVALKAAEMLAEQGISVSVIDMYSIKPLDAEAVKEAAKAELIVTVEDHQITGGLGSAVSEVAAEYCSCRVVRIGVQDSFGRSAPSADLLFDYGLTAEAIVSTVKENRKI